MSRSTRLGALALLIATTVPLAARAQTAPAATSFRERLPQDEVIYFLLPDRFDNGDAANDRGGLTGDRLKTGYDPTAKGFYHGGDLKGLIRRLGYIQDLGATAIWVGPIFKNKPVQGPPGQESAGYHGYWITDFTRVDPHLGSNADFKALVDAAHARGMKVYMDIIANHTADVIQYRECGPGSACPYRSIADYPFQRRGGPAGAAINPGFLGENVQTPENFARLTDPTYAYTPYVPPAEANIKVPAWLNDVRWYHERGNTTYYGESAILGDFAGLDDLDTENPRVAQGMIEIFGGWIDRYGVDGFRIDTARHVNPEFWARFVPAMRDRAKAKGIPNFHIFGEVAYESLDVGMLAHHTIVDKLPAVLDFAFRQAVLEAVTGQQEFGAWDKLVLGDALYAHGFDTAVTLPTFVSNHDAGRLGFYIRKAFPGASDDEVLKREMIANAMLLTWRGVPTIYAGDEQGFAGDGGDQDAREDMFASKVAVYNDNRLIGSDTTTAIAHFGEDHPLFKQIAALARLRLSHPALTRGWLVLRARDDKPGLVAVSRIDPGSGAETLLVFNTSAEPLTRQVAVEAGSTAFTALAGHCAASASAPGSVTVTLAGFGYAICEAHQ